MFYTVALALTAVWSFGMFAEVQMGPPFHALLVLAALACLAGLLKERRATARVRARPLPKPGHSSLSATLARTRKPHWTLSSRNER
jgi:hypothetical protein